MCRTLDGWIWGSAIAWIAGLSVFFAIATPLWHDGQDSAATVIVGVLAGLAMAITMAVVSGAVLARLVPLELRPLPR